MEINLKTVVAQLSIPADTRPLTCIKFNKNRTRIATGSRTGYCKIWDIKGKCYATLKAHTDRLSDLIWNPNSEQNLSFITSGCDMNIYLWNKNKDKIAAFPIEHTNRISKMIWHPFIDVCFSTSFDKTWCMWDIETTQAILKQPGHENSVYSIALHPDGGLCATSDLSGHIRLWDIRKGQHVWGLTEHVKQVLCLDFSPKGYLFASGSDDNSIKIWDLRKKKILYSIAAHNKPITSLMFAPKHGNYMISTSRDCTVKLWNSKRFSLIRTVKAHEEAISCSDISSCGELMATASFDRTFKIWGPEHINIDN